MIEKLYAVVADDGEEGIMGEKIGDEWLPFVTSKEHLILLMADHAAQLQQATGVGFKVLCFTVRTDVTDQFPPKRNETNA
jgi:hypothetical protein